MSKENLVIIFVRNPKLGKVKTRLAKAIGDTKALAIYEMLLQQTKVCTQDLACHKVVFYSDEIHEDDLWENTSYEKQLQFGFDLGTKMKNAFEWAFENRYKKVVLIGSDMYDLKPHHIEEAFEKLATHDVVLGPAQDGGYYLLGLTQIVPKIFQNKSWGTSTVREETLQDLEKVTVHLLEELNDVDVVEDIQHHPAFSTFLIPNTQQL